MSFKYSIEVYDDYALIKGCLSSDVLTMLTKICKKEKFAYMVTNYQFGFKLVRKDYKDNA